MKFHDFTILGGTIYSKRQHDTATLAARAVQKCRVMLYDLHAGKRLVASPPEFRPVAWTTALGLPDALWDKFSDELSDAVRAPNRFFCVGEVGADLPFALHLVLPRFDEMSLEEAQAHSDPRVQADARTIGTLLGISLSVLGEPEAEHTMDDYELLWNARPCLLSAILPFSANQQLISLTADFATCFAAAMLQEARPHI